MPSKLKKKPVASTAAAKPRTKPAVKSRAKPAVKSPVKTPSKKGLKKPAPKAKSKAASTAKAATPVQPLPKGKGRPVFLAGAPKEHAGKKNPDYMQLVISLGRDLGGKIPLDVLNDSLPSDVVGSDEVERVVEKLRKLDIEVVRDATDIGAPAADAQAVPGKTRATSRADSSVIDDPVRMYLKQMGQVPLLTREQEVEISKRIEEAEIHSKRLLHRFGFAPPAYFDMIERLKTSRERFDRIIIDKHEGAATSISRASPG